MLQITRSPRVFDVVVVGSGAGGGTAVKVLTDLGLSVALLEAGPMLNPAKDFKEHVLPYQVDHRGAGVARRPLLRTPAVGLFRRAERLLGHSRRTLHRGRGQRVQVVPLAHCGRPHQPLRAHLAALLGLRFPARGRPRRPLAGHLRRNVAVVRQGRGLHRRHRHQGGPAHGARRQFSAAHPAAGTRTADPEVLPKAGNPVHSVAHGDADQVAQRARGVPLLRAVRARLPDGLGVLVEPGHDFPGHEDRQADHVHRGHGARTGDRRLGQGDRRFVRR